MKEQALAKENTSAASTAGITRGFLQRKCACGTHTIGGSTCNACSEKQQKIQRHPAGVAERKSNTAGVPTIVNDVLRSSGQPLDAATRSFMEPHFGQDFSHVRVHTDAQAIESARAVNALAYTVGQDIVFGAGGRGPGTAEGNRLLAHELTHVLQLRNAANGPLHLDTGESHHEQEADSVSKSLPSSPLMPRAAVHKPLDHSLPLAKASPLTSPYLQRQQAGPAQTSGVKTATVPSAQQVSDKPKETDTKKVAELGTEIAGILKPSLTALEFKQLWSDIEKQIKSPVAAKPKSGGIQKKFAGLLADKLVENLNALPAEERVTVAQDVYDQLIKNLTGLASADFTKEFNSLDTFVRNGIEGGIRGYVSTRGALMNTFGSVAKINEYYKSMVQADFPSATSKVKGRKTSVHPNLRERLQRGSEVLKKNKVAEKTWLDITEEGISSIGGFNIRENRNKTSALSFHSFGWAIDIDAALNPNVKAAQFPQTLVKGFTGEDVYKGEAVKAIRTGGTAETLLPQARALRESSDLFKKSLESEASLKTATATYLKGKGLTIASEQSDALFNLLKAGTSKNKFNKPEIEKWLSETKAAAEPKPATTKPAAGIVAVAATPTWAEASPVADFLIEAYKVFLGTTNKAGAKVSASTTGTPQTIGAQGFLSLPAELIAALTGSDGGGLNWLGGIEKGTKDFMHFELKKADQPELPKEAAKTSEAKPEAAEDE